MPTAQAARKRLGAWYTPAALVDVVAGNLLDGFTPPTGRPVRVLDPACGDGRFLFEIRRRLGELGATGVPAELTGCDVDHDALETIGDPAIRTIHANALAHDWSGAEFDIVVGNPPFLSQMAAGTTRGGSSRHGGGPYADAAAEFLALAVRLARPDGGRVGLVLPQSILGARDAGPIRERVAAAADLTWSWWEPRQRHFDASVNVCALGFRRPATRGMTDWTSVVTGRLGMPSIGRLAVDGTIGDRAELNANFRDEYYALVPAVGDDSDGVVGPPLVTSGLIDPGRCLWGQRPVTFARRTFSAPRVDLTKLTGRFPRWARRKLVPKVLVANQTRVVEAVPDPFGEWLPGVPVNTVTPLSTAGSSATTATEIAAVLTSPVATATVWRHAAGTGLSTNTVRVSPAVLGSVPWPAGDLAPAVDALDQGDVVGCATAVLDAYGLDGEHAGELLAWWCAQLPAWSG